MDLDKTRESLQIRSLVKSSGVLELSLVSVPTPEPRPDEVVIRVDAAPINPSDLGLLFGAADMSTARQSGTADRPVVTASIPEGLMKAMAARVGPVAAGRQRGGGPGGRGGSFGRGAATPRHDGSRFWAARCTRSTAA